MSSELVLTDRAALALLDEIERALTEVATSDDADLLWRKVKATEEAARLAKLSDVTVASYGRVRLRAKRRWGELLGPAEPSRKPEVVTGRNDPPDERVQRHRARKLAKVPEKVFEAALAESEPDKLPSEASIRQLAKRESRPKPEPIPTAKGIFPVLYADPPWRYEHNETPDLRAIENQYPTMSIEEICALEVPAAEDAVLFLWATNPKLREGLEVIEAWGFEYRTNACWVKDRIGMGYYVRGQHELLLIGRRGKLPVPEPSQRPASVIKAPRGKHSEKPLAAYELIETMYPALSKVELFARQQRRGWEGWGNQLRESA